MSKNYTVSFGKYVVAFLLSVVLSVAGMQTLNAQVVKTVKASGGDFSSISAAVTYLNTNGVPAGGITINVDPGFVEPTLSSTIVLTATGTASSPIVFQNAGTPGVSNPLIAAPVGTVSLATTSTTLDGIWAFTGSDYVTINGIDLVDNNTMPTGANSNMPNFMEYGYGFFKNSVTDGANNNTIKNCTVTLNRLNAAAGPTFSSSPNFTGATGIIFMPSTISAISTVLTPTALSGTNSNNKVYSNTIQNGHSGIIFFGYSATAANYTTLGDQNNDIGGSSYATGNTIKNFAGVTSNYYAGAVAVSAGAVFMTSNNYVYRVSSAGTLATTAPSTTTANSAITSGTATLYYLYTADRANGILVNNQYGINISYNTINNNTGAGINGTNTVRGIITNNGTGASLNITYNKITISTNTTSGTPQGIENGEGSSGSGNKVNISYNNIKINAGYGLTTTTNTFTVANTGAFYGIWNNGAAADSVVINNDTLNIVAYNTSGTCYSIYQSAAVNYYNNISNNDIQSVYFGHNSTKSMTLYNIYNASMANQNYTFIVNNNSIDSIGYNTVGATPASGTVYNMYIAGNSSTTSGTYSFQYNHIRKLYLYFTGTIYNFYQLYGAANATIKYDTVMNVQRTATTASSGTMYGLYAYNTSNYATVGSVWEVAYNYIANINNNGSTSSSGTFYGIYSGGGMVMNYHDNIVTNITSGSIYGLYPYYYMGTLNMYNNTVSNITSLYTSGSIYGLYHYIYYATGSNIYNNTIYNLNCAGNSVYGIYIYYTGGGQSVGNYNFYKNKVANLTASGTTATVYGIYAAYQYYGGITGIYNNTIGNLYAPNSSLTAPAPSVAGMYLTYSSSSQTGIPTFNCYHNTIYLNATSTGTNFGTAGIWANSTTAPYPPLTLNNNIIVNTSTPRGTGLTVAYQRSGSDNSLYKSTSDNNLFYTSNTPNGVYVIYYDPTSGKRISLTNYKSFMSTRDQNSVTEMPPFASTNGAAPNFLHLDSTNLTTQCLNGGTLISGITTDFDGDARPTAGYTNPTIGADEYVGVLTLADNGVQVGAQSISAGSTSNILANATLTATNVSNTLGSMAFVLNGASTYTTSDVATNGFKLWSSTTNSFGTATLLKSVSSATGAGETITFSGLNQAITKGNTYYYWFTVDVPSSTANTGDAFVVNSLSSTSLTFNANTNFLGSTSAAGKATISVPCNSSPAAGTASVSVGTVCPGSSSVLSLTGTSVATGITYQWQSTTDTTSGFNDIPNDTTNTVSTGALTQTTYFQCVVTCVNTGQVSVSNTVVVNVYNTAVTITPTVGGVSGNSYCGYKNNSVKLVASATPGYGGATPTFSWTTNTTGLYGNAAGTVAYTTGNLATVYAAPDAAQTYTVVANYATLGCGTVSQTQSVVIGNKVTISSIATTAATLCSGNTASITTTSGIPTIVGTGTLTNTITAYPSPFGQYYGGDHMQMIIPASELTAQGIAAGNFTSMSFNLAAGYSYNALNNFQIQIAATAQSDLSSGTYVSTGFTSVYGPTTYTPPNATGWATISFTTPFYWNGTSNVVISVWFNNANSSCSSTFSDNGSVYQSSTSYTSVLDAHADGSCTINSFNPGTTITKYSQRPNIQLGATVPLVYSWTSTPANATNYLSSKTVASPTFTMPNNGSSYTYFFKATEPGGCYATYLNGTTTTLASVSETITSGSPNGVISGNPASTVCPDSSIKLLTTTITGGCSPYTYVWQVDGKDISPSNSNTSLYGTSYTKDTLKFKATSGMSSTYTVTVTDANGNVFVSPGVTVNSFSTSPAAISAASTKICGTASSPIKLTASGGGSGKSYTWNDSVGLYTNSAGTISYTYGLSANVVYAYPSLTKTYTVATTDPNGCAIKGSKTINYYNFTPSLSVSASPTSVCAGTVSALTANVSIPTIVGTGTVTNTITAYPSPFGQYYGSDHLQMLVPASELAAQGIIAGNITSIGFNLAAGYSYAALQNFQIQIANTSLTDLSGGLVTTGYTSVYGPTTYTPPNATGWANINFTTPFYWNGTSNVVVTIWFSNCSVCNGTSSCTTSFTDNASVYQTTTSYVSSLDIHADGNCTITSFSPSLTPTQYSQRPNIQFGANVPTTLVWSPATDLYTDSAHTTAYAGGSTAATKLYALPSATASYSITATQTASGCSASSNATTITLATGSPTIASLTAKNSTICFTSAGNDTLTAVLSGGCAPFTYKWSTDGGTTFFNTTVSNSSTNTVSVLPSVTTVYTLIVTDNAGNTATGVNTVNVNVSNPVPLSVTGASRCGAGSVKVSATHNVGDVIDWYSAPTGGTFLGSGDTLTTSVTSTTNVYATANTGGAAYSNLGLSTYTYYSYSTGLNTYGQQFNANAFFILNSVVVYPYAATDGTAGTVTIALVNSSGTVLQSQTVNVLGYSSGTIGNYGQTVNLGFSVPVGTGYKLVMTAYTGISGLAYFYNSGNNLGYPFTDPSGAISITGASLAGTIYNYYNYYFWNFAITTGCEGGTRMATAINVTTPATLTVADTTQVSNQSISVSTSKNVISNGKFTVGGSSAGVLDTLSFVTKSSSSYTAADIATNGFKLWYSTTNNFGGATQLGSSLSSTKTTGSETIKFTGLNLALTNSTTYFFWLTADISAAATIGDSLIVNGLTASSFKFSSASCGGTITGSTSASGKSLIVNGCAGKPSAITFPSYSVIACTGQTAPTFTGTDPNVGSAAGYSYQWYAATDSLGSNPTPIATQTTLTYAPATFSATGINYYFVSTTCSFTNDSTNSGVIKLYINATPAVTVSSSISNAVCYGTLATLTATGAASYSWSPSTTLSASTGATVTDTVKNVVKYTVTGTTNGCSATASVTDSSKGYPSVPTITAKYAGVCNNTVDTLTRSNSSSGAVPWGTKTPTCSANSTGDPYITSVSIGTLNMSFATGNTTVRDNAPSFPSNTTILVPGTTYTFSMTTTGTTYPNSITSVWIDYNQNGIYDSSEWVQPWTSASSGSVSITIPANAKIGATGMRVRSRGAGNPNGIGDGCSTSFGSGNTEDFTVYIDYQNTYTWSDGTNNLGSGTNIGILPTNSGNTTSVANYYVTTTNVLGCSVTSPAFGVNVYPSPAAPTATSTTPTCGAPTFTIASASGFTGSTYAWYNAPTGGSAITGQTSTTYTPASYSGASSTTVYATEISTNGCESQTRTVNTVASTTPSALALNTSSSTICLGTGTSLSVTPATVTNYNSYKWLPVTSLYTDAAFTTPYVAGTNVSTVYVKPTVAGTVTYSLYAKDTVGGCTNTVSATLTAQAIPTFTAQPVQYASCGVVSPSFTTTVASTGTLSYTWQFTADTTGGGTWATVTNGTPTGVTYSGANTATLSASNFATTYYYRVQVSDGVCSTITSSAVSAISGVPTFVSTAGATNCNASAVPLTLKATPSTGYATNWYAASTGGTSLASGNSYTTPASSTTTTYYAEPYFNYYGPNGNVGYNTYSYYSASTGTGNYGLQFNANAPFILNSVVLYPYSSTNGATGTVTIALTNSVGTILQTATVAVTGYTTPSTSTAQTVNLGFSVPAGTGYQLVMTAYTNNVYPSYWYNSGLNMYPFNDVTNTVSITSGILAGTLYNYYYYYFWNWNVTPQYTCSGTRVPVIASHTTSPSITVSTPSSLVTTICSGNAASVSLSSANSNYSYSWSPGGATGSSVSLSPTTTTTYVVTAVDSSGGIYNSCSASANVTVVVGQTPTTVSATASPTQLCSGGNVLLKATGGATTGMSILPENFESALPVFSSANSGVTATTNTTYYSGGSQSILLTYANNSTTGAYQLNRNIDLSKYNAATLTFKHICATEAASDYGYLEFSTNGGTSWSTVPTSAYTGSATLKNSVVSFDKSSYTDWNAQFTTTSSTPTTAPATSLWKTETVNLASYLTSSQFRLRFKVTSNSSNVYYGWLIDDISITGNSKAVWSWTSNPAGYTSAQQNPTPAPSVSTVYSVAATNTLGCASNTTTASVTVLSASTQGTPVASTTGYCNDGTTTSLSLTQTGGSLGSGAYWAWYTNATFVASSLIGTTTASDASLTITAPTASTTYYLRAEGTSGSCSISAGASVTVTVYQKPTTPTSATATYTTICNGASTALSLVGGGGASNQVVAWYSDASFTTLLGTGSSFVVSPSTTTTYYGRYEVGSPCSTVSGGASVTINVTQKATPSVSIASTFTTFCSGTTVTITATPTSGGTTPTYSFIVNGATVQNSTSNVYTTNTFANGDSIVCTMVANNTCQTASTVTSKAIYYTVYTLPVAAVTSAATSVCIGGSTNISGTITATGAWTLNLSNGNVVTGTGTTTWSSSVTPGTTTTYSLSTLSDSRCNAIAAGLTGSEVVTVKLLPTSSISPSTATICSGGTFTLSGASVSNNASYVWSTSGNGTFSSQSTLTPVYTPGTTDKANGTATITLTATANTPCAINATSNLVLTVNPRPTASITTSSSSICSGSSTTIGGAITVNGAWTLTLSDGTVVTGNGGTTWSTSVSPTSTKTYTITSLSDSKCSSISTDLTGNVTVTVKSAPTANAGNNASTTLCGSGTYTVTNATATNYASFVWTTSGDGSFSSTSVLNPTYTPGTNDKSTGTVTLTITASNSPCTIATSSIVLTINPRPTASITTASTSVCAGSSVTIGGAITANGAWTLTLSDNSTVTGTGGTTWSKTFTPSATATYTLTSLVDSKCTSISSDLTGSETVTYVPKPTAYSGNNLATVLCGNSTYTVTNASVSNNASFSWSVSGDGTLSSTTALNPTYTPGVNDIKNGTANIILTANPNSPCASSATSTVILSLTSGGWTGDVSTDWNDSRNWCGGVPTSSTNVIISSSASRMPVLTSNVTINGLSLAGSLSLGGYGLTINGTLVGKGYLKGSSTSTLTINSSSTPTLYFNAATTDSLLGTLTIGGTGGAKLGSGLGITTLLSVNAGNFNTNGNHLTLKSTSITNTAVVGPVLGSITGGNVTVERYIPQGYKAYRSLVTGGVYNTGSVFNNWQEGGVNTNGYGVYITGKKGTASGVDAITGLDLSVGGYNSMFTYPAPLTYSPVTNTKTTSLDPYTGYLTVVYGNRGKSMFPASSFDASAIMHSAATVRTTGTLVTGTVTFTTTGVTGTLGSNYSSSVTKILSGKDTGTFIANPYACAVSWSSLAKVGLTSSYYYYEPTYLTGGFQSFVSYNPIANTNSNPTKSKINNYIQPGQGIWIQTNSVVNATRSLTFTESNKVTNQPFTAVFGTGAAGINRLPISLWKNGENIDGAVAVFNNNFATSIGDEDSKKISGAAENIYINEGSNALSIDGIPMPSVSDVISLQLSGLTVGKSYDIRLDAQEFNANGLTAYLQDAKFNTQTVISSDSTVYNFVPASTTENRFSIVFKHTTPLAVRFITVKAVVAEDKIANTITWTVSDEVGIDHYELEQSSNAIDFVSLTSIKANSVATYSAIDRKPINAINYYRVKAIGKDGKIIYSQIVKVTSDVYVTSEGNITIAPNPIKGNVVYLQLNGVQSGKYVASIYSKNGQQVMSKDIEVLSNSSKLSFNLANTLASGTYSLKLVGQNHSYQNELIIQR